MLNILIFLVSVTLGLLFSAYKWGNTDGWSWLQRVSILGAIFIPLNINGNIFTIAGNGTSDGNFYSVVSFYQRAEKSAFTAVGPAATQRAGSEASVLLGIAAHQHAENVTLVCGIAFWQKAKARAMVGLGLGGYQRALEASAPAGIVILQRSGKHERAFGAFSTFSPD